MTDDGLDQSGTFALGALRVRRLGYGAMHLSGPGVFGPPKDWATAIVVLREALDAGVNHIDTSDYYGLHVTNRLGGEVPPLVSATLSGVAQRVGATPTQVAIAWLLRRAPRILLIPGASSVEYFRENLAAATLHLPDNAFVTLDGLMHHTV